MKRWKKSALLVAVAGMLVATGAWAAESTPYFTVTQLHMGPSMSGYRVYPLGGVTQNNPNNCVSNDYYELDVSTSGSNSTTAAEKDVINRTLLAAFLAGKKVSLRVSSSTCGPNNRPTYHQVMLDRSE